jgi:hypothetical protein
MNSAGDSGAIEGNTEILTDKWFTVHVVLKGTEMPLDLK